MSQAISAPKVKLVPWWLVLIEGVLLIIIGIFLLTNPASTFVTIIWVLGLYWLISGIFNIIKIFFDSSMWGWKIFAGIVGIIAGWFLIQNPISGSVVVSATTVILLGLFGIFIGIVNLIQAFRGAGWGTGILGVISIILGILLLANRFLFTFSLPWALGILAIIGGIIAIFNAFRIRSAKKDLEDAAEAAQARMAKMAESADAGERSTRSTAAGVAAVGAAAAAAEAMDEDEAEPMAGAAAEMEEKEEVDMSAAATVVAAAAVAEAVEEADEEMDEAPDAAKAAAAAAVAEAAEEAEEEMAEEMDEGVVRVFGLEVEVDDDLSEEIAEKFPNLSEDDVAMISGLVAAVRSLTPEDAEKLVKIGIEKAGALLERGASRPGRSGISSETGIEETVVLKWVNDLDLARIDGVGVKYSDLLEHAGVDTVVELAQRNPENLHQKLVEVNEAEHLVERIPSEEEVADWVAQAKELPRVITY